MSAWRLLLRGLDEKGGGPLRLLQFDKGETADPQACMNYVQKLGLVENHRIPTKRRGEACIWKITPLGHAFVQGKARLVKTTSVQYI